MLNLFKSGTTLSSGTITRNNFVIAVQEGLSYGPTSTTGFWAGITPPSGGYTIYNNKTDNGPSIFTSTNDANVITTAQKLGGTNINTINDALIWFNGQSDKLVTNIDYPNIVTSGLTLITDAGYVPSYPKTGATWNDLSGNVNNATISGGTITWVSSGTTASSSYFVFSGTQAAALTSLNLQQNFTLDGWFNPSVLNGFVMFGQGTTSANQGLHIWYTSNTNIRFGMYANDTDFNVSTSTGNWYNIVCTYSNTSPYTKQLYLNGVAQTGSIVGAAAYAGSGTFRLGATYSSGGQYGSGYYSGMKMYNRILTQAEITQNYNALKGRYGL
jgi:hypothetical protein